MDKLKAYALQQLARDTVSSNLKRRYTPPPAPTGLKAGTPVNVSRPAPTISRGVSNLPAVRTVYTPPPPPTITERVAQAFTARPDARQALAQAITSQTNSISNTPNPIQFLPPVQPVTMGFQTATETQPEQDDTPLTLYQLPDGTDVVMPSTYIPPAEWEQQAEITDPQAMEHARNSPLYFDNQPPEIQAQVQQPTDQPSLSQVRNPDQPLWIGDDQARQQEELANQDQAAKLVTAEHRERLRQAIPVTMASDFAREQEQVANQDAAAQRVANAARLRGVVNAGRTSQPIAQDIQRLQQEIQPQQPTPEEPRDWVIIRSERDGTIRAVQADELEGNPLLGPVQVIGSPITEGQAATINANPDLANPRPLTGEETGDEGQVSLRSPYQDDVDNWWGEAWDTVMENRDEILDAVQGFPNPGAIIADEDVRDTVTGIWRKAAQAPNLLIDAIPDEQKETLLNLLSASVIGVDLTIESIRRGDYGDLAQSILSQADDFLNARIPGTDMTVRGVLRGAWQNVIVKPQEYTAEQMIEAWYYATTGTDNRDGGNTRWLGILAATMGNGAASVTTFPDWIAANEQDAVAAYEQGVDTNGDGQVDLTGADAVMWLYEQDASAWDYFWFQTVSDPWNWTMALGALGSGLRVAGQRGVGSGLPLLRGTGQVLESTGRGLQLGSRLLEGIGSLGLDFAVEAALERNLLRRLIPNSTGQTQREILEGADTVMDSVGSGLRLDAPAPTEVTEITRGADDAVTGVKMGDGSTVVFTPEQAAEITRQLDASKATNADVQALFQSLRNRGIDVTDTPPRFLKPIAAIDEANPGQSATVARVVDDLNPGMRHHVVAMHTAYSNGPAPPNAAIDTSRMVSEWNRAFTDAGLDVPPYVPTTPNQSPHHQWAEQVIHTEWSSPENVAARRQLYQTAGAEHGIRNSAGAGDVAANQAERYADLVDEHLRWNPDAMSNPEFERAYQQAQAIRDALADRGVRPRNSYSRRPSRTTGTKTPGSDTTGPRASSATSDGATPTQGRGTSTGATTPTTGGAREIPIPRGTDVLDEADGYPVIARRTANGVTEEGIQVAENVRVVVRPVEAEFEARATNTLTNETGDWLRDPTKEGALNLAIEDARARGWMDEVTAQGSDPAPTPDIAAAPTPDPTPPTATETAVTRGLAAADDTFDSVRRLYRWSDDDLTNALDVLDGARNGRDVTPITANDLNSPGGRGLMQDVNNLLDKRRALAEQESIASGFGTTPKQARQAKVTADRLRKEIEKLETAVGLRSGQTRLRINATRKLIAETGSQQANQYIRNLNRMVEVRHMDRGTFRRLFGNDVGVVVDNGGLAYMSTPFGDIPLAPDDLAELTRHTFENGDTTLDRWMKHINADARNPKRTPEGIIENARKRTLAELRDDFEARFPKKNPNIITRNWERYSTYLRNQILGSWISAIRYWSNTYFGNLANLFLGGYWTDAWKAADAKKFYRLYRDDAIKAGKAAGADPFDFNPDILELDRIANTFGTSRAPELRKQIRAETSVGTETPIEDWATRHRVPKMLKEFMRAITGDSRVLRWALAGDTVQRDIVGSSAFYREIKPAIKDFKREAKTRLMGTGLSDAQADEIINRFTKAHPTGFDSSQVYDYFHNYFPDGMAERLSRDWQAAVNKVEKNARAEIQRVTFAGRETVLDEKLRPFIMFNFFMSRQYGFLLKQGLRHPGLINAYINYTEFAEEYLRENPDLPTWAKGLIRVTGMGPQGWALMLNPTALWAMGNLSFGGDEGGITLESIWRAITNPGDIEFTKDAFEEFFYNNPWIFIHPGITSALNLMGYLGDQRAFDPLNMNTWGRFWALGENWMRYKGWLDDEGMVGNRVADTGNQIRDWFSDMTDGLPWAEHIEFSESVGREEQEMRAIAWDLAIQQGRDPENNIEDRQWLDEQMMDPTSDFYKEAFRRYLNGETANLSAKLLPLVAATQPFGRFQDRNNEDLMESVTRADYLSEFKQFVRTNDPDSRALDLAADRYYALEDDHPYANNDLYNTIAYGHAEHSVIIDGEFYSADTINAMGPDERVALAKAWLVDEGVYEYWQDYQTAEDEFLAQPENRAFAQNKSWQRGVYDYGVEEYWQDVIQHNPNARRYYEGLDPDLTEEERIQALTNRQAFMAVAGFQRNIYEPEPLDTNYYDPLDIANKAPQPIPYEPYVSDYEQETRDQVAKYEREMSRADPVIQRIMSDWGMDPDVPFNQVYYKTRFDIMDEYERRTGKKLPYEESDSYWAAQQYWQWADVQPVGADTSLDAYFEANEQEYIATLPANFNADYDAARDDMDSYDWYDDYRSKDPGYRWEDEG